MNFSTSPPASRTARIVASLSLRWRSAASFSRRAFVLLDPDGATPVISTFLSLGVKFTNPIAPPPPPLLLRPPPPPFPAKPPDPADDEDDDGVRGSCPPPADESAVPDAVRRQNDRLLRTEMELDRWCCC